MTKTLYLAGPMSGYKENNVPQFRRAAAKLRQLGLTILSPVDMDEEQGLNPGAEQDWTECLGRDLVAICDEAEGVVCLPAWDLSRGACLEVFIAIINGKELYRYEDSTYRRMDPSWALWCIMENVQENYIEQHTEGST